MVVISIMAGRQWPGVCIFGPRLGNGGGLTHGREYVARPRQQPLASRKQTHAPRTADKELDPEVVLKRTNPARQWWLADVQPASGPPQMPLLGDRDKGLKLDQRHVATLALRP